jgi:hypothetical protein
MTSNADAARTPASSDVSRETSRPNVSRETWEGAPTPPEAPAEVWPEAPAVDTPIAA